MVARFHGSFSNKQPSKYNLALEVFPGKHQVIEGIWRSGSVQYRDRLNRIFVDAEDIPENRLFFTSLKTELKEKFRQLDIWLTVHPIEIL